MSSTMSCLWDRTKNCGDLRFYLFENVVFVKSVAPITRLSYLPCLLIYITLCLDVTLESARCSSLITLRVPVGIANPRNSKQLHNLKHWQDAKLKLGNDDIANQVPLLMSASLARRLCKWSRCTSREEENTSAGKCYY